MKDIWDAVVSWLLGSARSLFRNADLELGNRLPTSHLRSGSARLVAVYLQPVAGSVMNVPIHFT